MSFGPEGAKRRDSRRERGYEELNALYQHTKAALFLAPTTSESPRAHSEYIMERAIGRMREAAEARDPRAAPSVLGNYYRLDDVGVDVSLADAREHGSVGLGLALDAGAQLCDVSIDSGVEMFKVRG